MTSDMFLFIFCGNIGQVVMKIERLFVRFVGGDGDGLHLYGRWHALREAPLLPIAQS